MIPDLPGGMQDLLVNDPYRKKGRKYSDQQRDNTLPKLEIQRPGPDTEGFYERLTKSLEVSEKANELSRAQANIRERKRQEAELQYLKNNWGQVDLSSIDPSSFIQGDFSSFLSGKQGSGSAPSGARPLSGSPRVSSPYGMRTHPRTGVHKLHDGIDYAVGEGTPIYATHSGTVSSAGWGGAWGNQVVIGGSGGISTRYAHQSRVAVKPGQRVTKGQLIGYTGNTGSSTGPHLHYAVYQNGSPVNPSNYF